MYTKIASTIFVKGLGAIGSFLIVVLTSRYLGTEGRGDISLFMANLALIQLFSSIITGPAMVYLVPRHNTFHLTFIAYTWSILMGISITFILHFSSISPPSQSLHLGLLAVLFSLFTANQKIIQGKGKINFLNLTTLVQLFSLLFALLFFYQLLSEPTFEYYLFALYISYGITLLMSFSKVTSFIHTIEFSSITTVLKNIFTKGFTAQIGNFFNFFNARFSYYLLAFILSDNKSSLGIYAVAVSITEAVFLISYGIAAVQYPAISNSNSSSFAKEITLNLSKLCFWITIGIVSILFLSPEILYTYIFGEEFIEIKKLIMLLSPGVIIMSVANIYYNYYGGTGNFKINNLAELLGFMSTLLFSYLFIKNYEIIGAAYACSITYSITGIYMIIKFKYLTNTPIQGMLPSLTDYKLLSNPRNST